MSDRHVVAALQRTVADLELRLREVARERDEAYADRARARTDRDEARAEVSRCHNDLRIADHVLMDTRRARDEALAELLSITQQLELEREASAQLRAELGERMRETAEAQRKACVWAIEKVDNKFTERCRYQLAAATAPLVTDTKADGGSP